MDREIYIDVDWVQLKKGRNAMICCKNEILKIISQDLEIRKKNQSAMHPVLIKGIMVELSLWRQME